jgi:hypothetical protein
VEHELDGPEWLKRAHGAKSPAKAAASKENGSRPPKEGSNPRGRPRIYQPEKGGKLEARIKNKKGREGWLRAVPQPGRYEIAVFYDGATDPFALRPEFQPKDGTVPDVEAVAELAGFDLI